MSDIIEKLVKKGKNDTSREEQRPGSLAEAHLRPLSANSLHAPDSSPAPQCSRESAPTQNIIGDLFSITGKKSDVGHLAPWETTTAN